MVRARRVMYLLQTAKLIQKPLQMVHEHVRIPEHVIKSKVARVLCHQVPVRGVAMTAIATRGHMANGHIRATMDTNKVATVAFAAEHVQIHKTLNQHKIVRQAMMFQTQKQKIVQQERRHVQVIIQAMRVRQRVHSVQDVQNGALATPVVMPPVARKDTI